MERRDFITSTLAGSAAAAFGIDRVMAQAGGEESAAAKKPDAVAGGIQSHRILGRTGLWISDIGMGTGGLTHPATAIRALELGVSYFDTAPDYGDAEEILGKAIKSAKIDRGSIVITSKMCEKGPYPSHLGQQPGKPATLADIVRCNEATLKRLQTDYLDVYMVHAIAEPKEDKRLDREDLPEAIDKLKKEGKIRHAGFSSHGGNNATALLNQAIDSDMFDVMMPAYNYLRRLHGSTPDDVDAILKKAKEKNIGVIAMKTVPRQKDAEQLVDLRKKLGDSASHEHLAFAWALAQDGVSGLVKTMRTAKEVETYVASSGVKLSAADIRALDAYAAALGSAYCRIGCAQCVASCPFEVPIPEVLRFNEYFVNYGQQKHAMRRFADVDGHRRLSSCDGCNAPCEGACPYNLPVQSLLARADDNLHFA
jgi:predicted aldo/keto reductase-like oxidoreductase